jgi:hypothetical protein
MINCRAGVIGVLLSIALSASAAVSATTQAVTIE